MMEVAAAVVVRDHRIMLAQRPPTKDYPWTWECPGGKQEPGEPLGTTIVRELEEELAILVCVLSSRPIVEVCFAPPEVGTNRRVSFFETRIVPDGRSPLVRDGVGLGWFSYSEFRHLRVHGMLTLANERAFDSLARLLRR